MNTLGRRGRPLDDEAAKRCANFIDVGFGVDRHNVEKYVLNAVVSEGRKKTRLVRSGFNTVSGSELVL